MGLSTNAALLGGRTVCVYALRDPRDYTVFYVGATVRDKRMRLASHLNDAFHLRLPGERCDILRAIKASGFRPDLIELENAAPEEWVEAEHFWISYLRSFGVRLTNKATGGASCTGTRQTEETRQRRRAAAIVRGMHPNVHSPGAREKAASKLRQRIQVGDREFAGIKLAAREIGIPYSTMQQWLSTGRAKRMPV